MESYQGNAVVNYIEYEVLYTRIIEKKRIFTLEEDLVYINIMIWTMSLKER